MVRINWTDQAVADLKEIADYIKKDSINYARLQVHRLRSKPTILKTNPYSGQKLDFLNDENIRLLTEGSYLIIYKIIDKSRVDIITVHHAARDLNRRNLGL
ncbi:MAG: type II toxin-antitoxin system RelE/ParE family toxin [Mongoliitalea sp.]